MSFSFFSNDHSYRWCVCCPRCRVDVLALWFYQRLQLCVSVMMTFQMNLHLHS